MPTSIPRTRNVLTMAVAYNRSVTRKAEKMATVVHELMHIGSTDQRRGSLLRAHKINRQEQNKPGKNGPWEPLAQRYRGGGPSRCERAIRHIVLLGFRVPLELHVAYEEGLALDPRGSNTVARPRRTLTGFLFAKHHSIGGGIERCQTPASSKSRSFA
jgi:hypothetical protein